MKLPFIFVIDYFYLCLGDKTYFNFELDIADLLKNDISITLDITDQHNFIRPDFTQFLKFLKSNFKNAEIFVYIPEFIYNHKILTDNPNINKPYLRTINNCYDTIISELSYKYPSLKKDKNIQIVFDTQLIIFSNYDTNIDYISDKIIKCSNYTYTYYSDIYDTFIDKYKINPDFLNKPYISNYIKINDISMYNPNGTILQKDKLYQNSLKLYDFKCCEIYNNNIKPDTLFQQLMKIIETNQYRINIAHINSILL